MVDDVQIVRTRWPLTVMLLRSQWDRLTDRECREWTDRSIDLIIKGQGELLLPHLKNFQSYVWLYSDDPR